MVKNPQNHHTTGHPQYREWGWKIFQSIRTYCQVLSGGYSGIKNVNVTLNGVGHSEEGRNEDGLEVRKVGIEWDDKMETFFLVRVVFGFIEDTDILMRRTQSETLKYLYLPFSDNSVLPFDRNCLPIQCLPLGC